MRPKSTSPSAKIERHCENCGAQFFAHASDIRRGKGRFCSYSCSGQAKRGDPARVWENIDKVGGCWIWLGERNAKGYGKLGKKYVHRLAWIAANGEIPDGMWVLHHCDNPSCVNPDHLFLGSHADNMRDMVAKGRSLTGERSIMRRHPEFWTRGEDSKNAVLSNAQARAIRLSRSNGALIKTLAIEYGVSETTIRKIVHFQTYKTA